VDLDQEAVFAGDPVALGNLGQLRGQFSDAGQLPGGRADPRERRHRQSQGRGADLHPVSGDDVGAFHALDSLGHGGRGHPDPAGQRGHGDPRVGVELAQQPAVHVIEQVRWATQSHGGLLPAM
jgi:hypothetical protein